MDIFSYKLGKNSGGGGGSTIDWADVGYSSEPSIITNYDTKAHTTALDVLDKWSQYPKKSSSSFNNFLYTYYRDVNRNEIICYPIVDITGLTSSTLFASAFNGMRGLKYIPKQILVNPGTANDLSTMFRYCSSLEEVDVTNLIKSNVTKTAAMFNECWTLKTIKGLTSANTGNVTDMSSMFKSTGLTSLDLSSFDTSKVTNFQSMFDCSANLGHINFGNNFKMTSVTGSNALSSMFGTNNSLDDETLNQILHILTTATNYTGQKTLSKLGFYSTSYPQERWESLSNWQEFINAGWTKS